MTSAISCRAVLSASFQSTLLCSPGMTPVPYIGERLGMGELTATG